MKRVALLVVEVVGPLVLLEVGVRMVVPVQVDVPHLRVYPEGYYTWYPRSRFTYHNLPNVVPAAADVEINEHGLRGPSLPREKPAGEIRVLVLGDSYTAAVQLPRARIFTTLLEEELNRGGSGGRYRVVNAGFNGVGTAQELLYFLHQGSALAPDVVVLQYAFNDLQDNLAHGGFRVTSTGLELTEALRNPPFWRAPLLAVRDAVGNRSLVLYLLYKMMTGAGGGPVAPAHADTAGVSSPEPGVVLVRELTARLIGAANAIGARVVLLTIPSPIYLGGGDAGYDAVVAAFRSLGASDGNRLVVGDPLFRESEGRGAPVYLAFDGHLGEQGHAIVATALADAIRDGAR